MAHAVRPVVERDRRSAVLLLRGPARRPAGAACASQLDPSHDERTGKFAAEGKLEASTPDQTEWLPHTSKLFKNVFLHRPDKWRAARVELYYVVIRRSAFRPFGVGCHH